MAQTKGIVHITGSRVIDPARQIDGLYDVLIVDGRIACVGPKDSLTQMRDELARGGEPAVVIPLETDHIVAPGFIDLRSRVHGISDSASETLASVTSAAARGGFTTICCMCANPVLDSPATLAYVEEKAKAASVHVRLIAAITKGEGGQALTEMMDLAEAGAVAFSDDGRPVSSSRLMQFALQYAAPLGIPIVEHCQDEELVGSGVMNEGPISTLLGLPGWPATGEDVVLARDLALVRATGAKYHAAHLSTAGSVELVRAAKREGLPVTAEVTPHHLLLTDAWVAGERIGPLAEALAGMGIELAPGVRYDTATKVNPPLRTARDCDALLGGLLDGTIDAIATDHAPHTLVDKDCEYAQAAFGISGFETALASLLALVHAGKLPLPTLIAALTHRPARAWNLDAGTLAVGAPADLMAFDPDEQWTVDPTRFASKGRNTPLAGVTLRGQVRLTMVGGEVVYEAGGEP